MRSPLKNKAVLVTGGAGFIGSHLVDKLLAMGVPEVVVVDNLFLGSESNLTEAMSNGAVLYKEDAEFATSLEYIFAAHDIGAVFNCATKALNYSFYNPAGAFGTNVNVILNLLELQRKGKFDTLCHFSTSEVYGTAVYEPMDEKHPKDPTTAYAAGKAAADLALESYVRMFGLDAFILRPFNNYGPRQNHQGPLAGVIPLTVMRILNDCAPEIHGDGNQSRDFIYVKDTVDAVIKTYDALPTGETVNISANSCTGISDLIKQLADMLHWDKEIIRKEARGADVQCHNASNDKLKGLIDFRQTPLNDGLKKTIDWYKDLQQTL